MVGSGSLEEMVGSALEEMEGSALEEMEWVDHMEGMGILANVELDGMELEMVGKMGVEEKMGMGEEGKTTQDLLHLGVGRYFYPPYTLVGGEVGIVIGSCNAMMEEKHQAVINLLSILLYSLRINMFCKYRHTCIYG
ncbi:hypothetical protein ACH5RR_007119 [Cinchona calisaya]|uniref:Uncharacterized protein n=1 Tax=Cinchona calisaya TaxID=153742 RepID=A0ABD3AR81_9GENT